MPQELKEEVFLPAFSLLKISSIWLFEYFFGKLHEYICMSKLGDLLGDRYFQCVPILHHVSKLSILNTTDIYYSATSISIS
jgi:hypothetical protein